MEYFCTKCGSRLDENYCCSFCKTQYRPIRECAAPMHGLLPDKTPIEIVNTLKKHEYLSNTLWILIGIIQIFLLSFALVGVCNIICAIISLIYTFSIKPYKYDVYEYYDKRITAIIVSIIINILFGGIFGVVGALYDLYIRHYVLKNKYAFNRI